MIPNILYANFNSKKCASNSMRFKNKREKWRERRWVCEGGSKPEERV